ncbi:hypothetical protein [Anoxybacillus flavithermus]|uniref:hypothetical protein n=1 Tax=Anoxybacillus flavithermus TaxID=33934 RepID=UPI00186919A3|nr:hypothetical protein [Anoxybacillus flavithermus]MBE2913706.1 hypothetical protein [Anoxybacillus flavithermus]
MDPNPILMYSVRELHIDLLFLEEFYSSEPFRTWFITNTTGLNGDIGALVRVEHSVFELERESDFEITFESPKGEVLFLIENKINAQFQPNQAEDYKNRGIEYVRRGKCVKFYTVLFAPEDYIKMIKPSHKFDFYLPFETVIAFFETQVQMGQRANYKISVLRKAIEKARSSKSPASSSVYQPSEVNSAITLFWKRYWEDLLVRHPDLPMPEPKDKGPAATFIGLGKKVLPPNVIIYHKFVHGFVDLQFEKLGEKAEEFISLFKDYLEEGMTIQRAGKSAVVVRIEVPKINPHRFYEDLQDDVHKAQDAAKRLLKWFNKNSNLWFSFSS